MSYTQADITALRANLAKGVAQAEVAGEKITFRSLAEMRSLLAEMEAAVAGPAAASRQHYPGFMERPS